MLACDSRGLGLVVQDFSEKVVGQAARYRYWLLLAA